MRPAVKKLLKQKGYAPIFQAIDNSKRQFKQMRYTRGEIQDTLIDMFGDEDPKILQKIKESVNEKWQTFKGLRILPSGATGDVVYFKNKKEMMKAFKEKKAKPIHEDVSPKGWNMSKKYIKFIDREVKNLKKYHRQQNEEDFLEVANYIELQLKQMKKDLNESINQKTLMKEGVDLYSHVKAVEQHLDDFRKDLDRKRGGSYESDSVEYEDDRWYNDSKKLKGRDKKLGQWEKKVKKSLDNLIKDFEKAWK